MAQETPLNTKQTQAERRDARLKAALKANMARRKGQARARAETTQAEPASKDKED